MRTVASPTGVAALVGPGDGAVADVADRPDRSIG
jgi:hypothetical protein